jgi:hypothetical protein
MGAGATAIVKAFAGRRKPDQLLNPVDGEVEMGADVSRGAGLIEQVEGVPKQHYNLR